MKNCASFFKFFLITFLLFLFNSCSKNDNETLTKDLSAEKTMICGKNIADISGTICCISGPETVSAGEIANFEYGSNLDGAAVIWTVQSGSITIESGGNSPNVSLKFGNDFTEGKVLAHGTGVKNECSNAYIIKLK